MIRKIAAICCILAVTAAALGGCKKEEVIDRGITVPVWSSAEESSTASTSSIPSSTTSTPSAPLTSSEYITTSNYTEFTANSENAPDVKNNITLITEKDFFSSDETEIKITVRNRTGWVLSYKNDYIIKKVNGESFIDVPFVENPDFGGEVYLLSTGMDGTATVDLTQLASKLEPGEYRLGIPILCNGYPSEFIKSILIYIK